MRRLVLMLAAGAAAATGGAPGRALAARVDGTLTVSAVDEETDEPLAVRMELRDSRGRAVRVRAEGAVTAGDSVYFAGEAALGLPRGAYTFLIEAGPEYLTRPGKFTIDRRAEDSAEVTLERRVDMREEGWWAGDLDVQLPLETLPLVMQARSVDFAPVAAMVNDRGRCRKLKAARRASEAPAAATVRSPLLHGAWATLDDRRGGGLLAIGAEPPIDVCRWKADGPSLESAAAASDAGAMVTALTPFAWDLPVWVAAGRLGAVQVINRHAGLNAADDDEDAGRPRDATLFPGALGNGRYSEAIYHHLLDCGLRLPPATGSGAGAVGIASPLGTNRTYVHCGETCTRESWLEGLRAGRVVVTNGPLLRVRVDGELPGYVFELYEGERREFQIELELAFYEATQVDYLEIVQNGRTLHHVRLDELAKKQGRLPPVEFDASGWFLVRAVTNNPHVYQYASTGPYYVEMEHQVRISRASVEYFLTWLDDAAKQFAGNDAVLAEIREARPFWEKRLGRANVE